MVKLVSILAADDVIMFAPIGYVTSPALHNITKWNAQLEGLVLELGSAQASKLWGGKNWRGQAESANARAATLLFIQVIAATKFSKNINYIFWPSGWRGKIRSRMLERQKTQII